MRQGNMKTDLIDMHIHILPGVDDGSKSIQETKKMLRDAYDAGIRTIVATPHCSASERTAEKAERIRNAYIQTLKICRELAEENGGDEITLLPGNEIYCSVALTGRIIEMIKKGDIFTINNSRYVLIEMSFSITYEDMFRIIKQFFDAGYIPVLAHVERYENLYRKWECIDKLIMYGVVIQMNAESLTEPANILEKMSRQRKWCRQLMEAGCVHIVSSDAHHGDGNSMAEAMGSIKKRFGEKKVRALTENAQLIISDNDLP